MSFKFIGYNINIKLSFAVLMLLMIALGFSEQFFILVACTTIHELAHILAARLFGLSCKKVTFTALGEMAEINGFEEISLYKRLIILFAGVAVNFAIAVFSKNNLVVLINTALIILNILPVYPLDGGKIVYYILCYLLGVLRANKISFYMGIILIYGIIVLGFFQIMVYSYNISLFCMGIYLLKINKREYIKKGFSIYKMLINKKINKISKINFLYVSKDTNVKDVLSRLCWDYYLIIYVENLVINQGEFIEYIINYGINGTVKDVLLANQT